VTTTVTESQEESDGGGGLPPAARWQEITLRNGEVADDIFVNQEEIENFSDGDIFYRRKDVKALIIEKIEHVEGHPVDEKIATEQSKILQELLEELEQ